MANNKNKTPVYKPFGHLEEIQATTTSKNDATFAGTLNKYGAVDKSSRKIEIDTGGKIKEMTQQAVGANQQTSTAKGGANKCNFCRKPGLQILPLRYSVTQTKAPELSGLLGKNVKNIALSYSKYTTEMIDSGYVYAMVKRKKGFEWIGYIVTPLGHLSSFPLDKTAPAKVQEFSCNGNEHALFSSFVTVEYIASNLAEKVYLIYTHVPMTKAKRDEYQKKADEYVRLGRWQQVDVAAWAGGSSQQAHCLNAQTLKGAIDQPLTFGASRWGKILTKFNEKPKAFASIALYDPIGITVKLNDYRNEAYAPVDDYLEAKDKNGMSNQRKLDAVQRLDTLKGSLEQKAHQSILTNAQNTASRIDYLETKDRFYLNVIDTQIADAKKARDFAEVARLEKSRDIMIQDHKRKVNAQNQQYGIEKQSRLEKLKADFQVCEDNIDFKEAEAFKQEAAGKYSTALHVANQRAQEHLNWINSESLLDALDVYDDHDLQNGCAFKAHVASMLFGMEGATASAEKIDSWIKKPEFERKNLFIRGLYSNQLEAKAKHDDAKKYATDFTAVGIKATKLLVDFLKKTDSAWDEWARNQDKNNTWNVKFFKPEKKVMLYVSNFARVVFRAGMGSNAESQFIRAISQKLLFAQMGELASKLEFNHVVYGINPEQLPQHTVRANVDVNQKNLGLLSAQAAKQATIQSLDRLMDDAMAKKQQVALTLEEIEKTGSKGMANHTNNYHQVRASGILVLIESINLAHMLSSGKYQNAAQIAALVASVSGLLAFGLDIFYGLAKGAREVASQSVYSGAGAAATKGAANIQRAGIKWAAGSLSAFSGSITCGLDFIKGQKYGTQVGDINRSLKYLYYVRGLTGVVSTVLGICAALTYIGPLMNYLKEVGGSPAIQRLGARLFGSTAMVVLNKATREIVRNGLLRGIAWASGIGLVLTLGEVAILIYMDFTKLERWCKHSTFRTLKTNKLMPEQQEIEDYQALFV
ncbi:T6SS effector BTH_I2691 family protein [Acinetobacter piscicola]|uniref:T6SS effector BTH_I2691 family protein n=1 Tax=Acinetobacter piscicola TaxID=2006115 RepID=UPI000B7DCA7C|nr:T6SS effector BTH_I2691 family protein [Acinetobacter piscicola]